MQKKFETPKVGDVLFDMGDELIDIHGNLTEAFPLCGYEPELISVPSSFAASFIETTLQVELNNSYRYTNRSLVVMRTTNLRRKGSKMCRVEAAYSYDNCFLGLVRFYLFL